MGAASGAGKVCAVCGEDCSGKPRTKDNKGRYFCQPCYERAKQSKVSKHASREAVSEPPSLAFGSSVSANLLDQLVAGAPPVQTGAHCPTCGFAMKADAVLCTNCGYNTQTHHAVNTKAYAAPKLSGSGQAWPIVIGVMSIVFGLLDTLLQTVNLVAAFSETGNVRARAGIVPIILALVLTYSGIQVILRRAAGAKRIVQWAWVKGVLGITCFGLMFVGTMTSQSAADAIAERLGLEGLGPVGLYIALAIEFLWYTGWAIFILMWFHRASVQSDIEKWS